MTQSHNNQWLYNAADCGIPYVNRYYVKLNYTSTLEGSVLILTCENDNIIMSNMNTTDEQILNVTCHNNASWIPNPADFIKSCLLFTRGTVSGTT